MVSIFLITALAATIPLIQGHLTFVRIALNNEWQHPTRYIRNKTDPYTEDQTPGQSDPSQNTRHYNYPTYASDHPESVRCGRGNLAHAPDTEVLTVRPGDKITFAHQRYEPAEWQDSQWYNCSDGRGTCNTKYIQDINHPGPVLAHLSKVPDGQDVRTYDGAGEWIKIYTLGLEMRTDDPVHPVYWLAYNNQQLPPLFEFKIPTQTPAGQYLLRIDLIWPGFNWPGVSRGVAQLYPSCAQIQVEGNMTGVMPKGVKVPEAFFSESPGMETSLEMYRSEKLDEGYEYPGGSLWDGKRLIPDKPVA